MVETYSFGYWVMRRRKALDLTREELARHVGCASETIKKIERDERRPSQQVAELLADALAVPTEEQTLFLQVARGERPVNRLPLVFESLTFLRKRLHNLPAPITSFVGREKAQQEVIDLLAKHRLVTLTGVGGIGKTRLSLQVGNRLLNDYSDGVWLVELASILDPSLVQRTTAIAIGLRDEPQRPVIDMLCDYLRDRQMLIILDNCEHLIEACASMTDQLLHAAPNVRVLASSREALGIPGEVNYRLPALGLPDVEHLPQVESLSQYEAITLFIERAKSAVPNFVITNENASALAQACHQLDGIPLAIELAAAKVHMLSLEQIAKRLADRFRLLTSSNRVALERHQTLRAAIDWSYNLLSTSEQILFRRLSVFVGGWTLEAAESVCANEWVSSDEVSNLLEQLINKSLVVVDAAQSESRYRMLETIRQYANEKLVESGESDTLRDQHLDYFLKLAETAEPHLQRTEQIEWLKRLDAEHDNLRTALAWALSNNAQAGLQLVGTVWWFWRVCGYVSEGCDWMEKVLALPEAMPHTHTRAKALHGYGFLESIRYDDDKARTLHEQSLSLYTDLGDKLGIAKALNGLGFIARRKHDWKAAPIFFEEALKIGYEIENRYEIAAALEGLGLLARRQGNWIEARSFFEKFLAIERELKNTAQIANALFRLGHIAFAQGDVSSARSRLEESLALYRELGFKQFIAFLLNELGEVARYQGDYEQALILYRESLSYFQEQGVGFENNQVGVQINIGYTVFHQGHHAQARELFQESFLLAQKLEDSESSALCLIGIAGILASQQKPQKAVSLISAARVALDMTDALTIDVLLSPADGLEYEHNLEIIQTQLDTTEFEAAWAKGQSMSLEQALAYALESSD